MLQCFVCSLIPKVSEKKGATGQSFIQKEITSYRIGTLGNLQEMLENQFYLHLIACLFSKLQTKLIFNLQNSLNAPSNAYQKVHMSSTM